MNKSTIFYLDNLNNSINELKETDFLTELDMQKLLANFPSLIPGDQIDTENPRKWLFVGRELSIPSRESEMGRWSIDHLFIDQDGIPTFVECKRAKDTRSRREVVAQMLEYAANATQYWNIESIITAVYKTSEEKGKTVNELFLESFDIDTDDKISNYWETVEQNLNQHKIRLIFIADTIHRELKRLVEFLNEEMSNVSVIAVELKQYQVDGKSRNRALIPRVVGLTEKAIEKKKVNRIRGKTNQNEFLKKCGEKSGIFLKEIIKKANELKFQVYWGSVGISLRKQIEALNGLITVCYYYPDGTFQFYFHKEWVKDSKEMMELKANLATKDSFNIGGEYTLTVNVEDSDINELVKLLDQTLIVINNYLKKLSSTSEIL